MIKHTLIEKIILKHKWEEHPSRVDGHIEVHERCAVRLSLMIVLLPLFIALSPLIVIVAWFKLTPKLTKFPENEWTIYTVKKEPDGRPN